MSGRDEARDSSFTKQNDEEVARTVSTSIPTPDRGHSQETTDLTMDPFEVRIRFTNHLQHLNASVTSSQKAAQYALKYRDMDEDLHSCILEQLERVCALACFQLVQSG